MSIFKQYFIINNDAEWSIEKLIEAATQATIIITYGYMHKLSFTRWLLEGCPKVYLQASRDKINELSKDVFHYIYDYNEDQIAILVSPPITEQQAEELMGGSQLHSYSFGKICKCKISHSHLLN